MSDNYFELESFIRGHHIYKDVWTPVVNEELSCRREEGNISDPYAVAFIKSGVIVGHVPRCTFNKVIVRTINRIKVHRF